MGMACKSTQNIRSVKNDIASEVQSPELLNGDWQLSSYTAFMSAEDFHNIPDYTTQKVTYAIDIDNQQLTVSRDLPKGKYDYALKSGKFQIWVNQSIVNIHGTLYLYSIDKNQLTLDSNIDPSIGADGLVFHFKKK